MEQEVKKLKVSLTSFGCQMNEYDSQVAAGILEKAGFEVTAVGGHPEESRHRRDDEGSQNGDSSPAKGKARAQNDDASADVILINTCSVREHAEERVYGRLGMLGKAKKKNLNLIIGLMGCMVEEHREKLFKRFPQLDLMIGTRNIKELPALIEEVANTRKQVAKIKQDGISIEYTDLIHKRGTDGRGALHAWLPVMTGCDKVCTFCIVPVTRGREVSMPAQEVCREANRLAGEGVKWITLLGQNVNSYRGDGRGIGFPELLEHLCQIEGLERISFTTSHPSDATEELFQVIAGNPKISRRFHLPLQSGSDRILKRMKRLHTYEDYRQKIERLRELVPDISITTDILAGFSGETEEDYEATSCALREIRFDGAYIFKYSVRPGTPAARLPDDVPFEIKSRRNRELLELQREITHERNQSWIGRTVEVFVEDRSAKSSSVGAYCNTPLQLLGRTIQEKKVVFQGSKNLIGTFQRVTFLDVKGETFRGSLVGGV